LDQEKSPISKAIQGAGTWAYTGALARYRQVAGALFFAVTVPLLLSLP